MINYFGDLKSKHVVLTELVTIANDMMTNGVFESLTYIMPRVVKITEELGGLIGEIDKEMEALNSLEENIDYHEGYDADGSIMDEEFDEDEDEDEEEDVAN